MSPVARIGVAIALAVVGLTAFFVPASHGQQGMGDPSEPLGLDAIVGSVLVYRWNRLMRR